MKFSSWSKQQKILIISFCIAFLVFAIGGILLILSKGNTNPENIHGSNNNVVELLADGMEYYPDKVRLDQPLEDIVLYDVEGKETKLCDYRGKNVIIIFWTSWCRYCKEELSHIADYEKLIASYDDVELLLLNRLDGEKETIEQAEKYLKDNKIQTKNYYDIDLKIYNSLGVKVIPTLLGINAKGILKLAEPDVLGGADQLEAAIDYIRYGGSYATEAFVTNHLIGQDGGVHTNYLALGEGSPSGNDVLSESQGIIMEYAVITENKKLFEKTLNFILQYMMNDNALAGWMVTEMDAERPQNSKVNSVIDDLRIYRALEAANQLWGGYEDLTNQWASAIKRHNTRNDYLIDFYDFKINKKANRLTLCFADMPALSKITDEGSSSTLYKKTYKILTDGFISKSFPVYYSWYDYNKGRYSTEDLNMAEAMVTLYNLARIEELKEETLLWLKDRLKKGGIKARYTVKGKIVDGYNYESTAIYASLMMIAAELGDEELFTLAGARMEWMRINDTGTVFNGSFGMGDGTDIYSYDQCMALLAYGYAEKWH